MEYTIRKTIPLPFQEVVEKVRVELKKEGFGVLTEIDVKATLKNKLDVEFPDYLILGTCNPPFAYKALISEPLIGSMLPCNVVVRKTDDERVEVAAVDPFASMQAVENEDLASIAQDVRNKLKTVIQNV